MTGSHFLIESEGVRVAVDCGMFQGTDENREKNRRSFPYDPTSLSMLFVTHSHLDHVGRIPKLVKDGFRGSIISTNPAKEIADLVFADSIEIARHKHGNGDASLYTKKDARKALSLWKGIEYHEAIPTSGGFQAELLDAGHALGSAMISLSRGGRKIVFTGDLGNSPTPLLRDTEPVTDASYLVMESVYGDRLHEDRARRREQIEDIVEETVGAGGVLMIPAFSIERTQEILYEIEKMMRERRIPHVPVFIDSPLAIAVTKIYKKYAKYFNKSVIGSEEGPFEFSELRFTDSVAESKSIAEVTGPKIIIAGSGMSTGGRIMHHEKRYLGDSKNTLLIVGYQAAGTLGRKLADGAKKIVIDGEDIAVRARVEVITGYSAHRDREGLFHFVLQTADTAKKVFVVMGEPKASSFFAQRLRDYLGVDAVVPRLGESFILDL